MFAKSSCSTTSSNKLDDRCTLRQRYIFSSAVSCNVEALRTAVLSLLSPRRRRTARASLLFPARGSFFVRIVRLFPRLCNRSGAEGEGRDFDANGSPNSNVPTPLDSPTDGGSGGGRGGSVNGRGYGSEDGGLMPLPIGPPQMERVNSSSSLTG